jgi:hypothetical protein
MNKKSARKVQSAKSARKSAYLKKPGLFNSKRIYALIAILGGLALVILGTNFFVNQVSYTSGQDCSSQLLNLKLTMPAGWNCKAVTTDSGTSSTTVLYIDTPSFNVQIGNQGLFFGLETQQGAPAHTGNSKEVYSDLKMVISAYYYDGNFIQAVGIPVTTYSQDYRLVAIPKSDLKDLDASQIAELATIVKSISMY